MKKLAIGIVSLLSAFYLISSFNRVFFFVKYKLEGKTYKLFTAKNSKEWQKGLMFYKDKKELRGADGMIFIFPDKDYRTFWNKNTYLDLDVYWIADDKVVGKDYLPNILTTRDPYTISSKEKVNKVVEIVVSSQ